MTTTHTTPSLPWDHGIRWYSERTVEPTAWPVSLDYVRDRVLRAGNGTLDDDYIQTLIEAAVDACEEYTSLAIMPQTWKMYLSGFPSGEIELPRSPVTGIDSIFYYDADADLTEWGSSPYPYELVPSGKYRKARVVLGEGESFPSTYARPDAVVITYDAGYTTVPPLLVQGICVHIAEQYKQRSLGVQNVQFNPAPLQLGHFWRKVY
jgi:uncharacterized phiE125 gp8 family phage protein